MSLLALIVVSHLVVVHRTEYLLENKRLNWHPLIDQSQGLQDTSEVGFVTWFKQESRSEQMCGHCRVF